MIPQSSFLLLAPIETRRLDELRQLLASMNIQPGQADAHNRLIPFAALTTIHFARLVILDDPTLKDIEVYGQHAQNYPLYLAFLADMDGDYDAFVSELVARAAPGLHSIFSCCQGFSQNTDLAAWIRSHHVASAAEYINWLGRT